MSRRSPLPEPLRTRPFTRAEARSLGLSDKRLRSSDIVRLGHGLYASADVQLEWPRGYEDPGHGMGLHTLAALLRQYPGAVLSHSTDDLVVISDAIVNRPWDRGQRRDGLDTLAGLTAALDRAGSVKGIRKARTALSLTRVGADSPPETRARLALVNAGLPEPEVQLTADPHDPRSPAADLGYRGLKIAIQYDGRHHRTPEQQAADAYRDEWFQRHGWAVIRLTWADQDQGFIRLVRHVRERLKAV